MANPALMDELRRLTKVDWIPNEITAALPMLSELTEEQNSSGKSAKQLIDGDEFARDMILRPFRSFAEKYTGIRDPKDQGGTFSTADFLADNEAQKFIKEIEDGFKEIHEHLVELSNNDHTGMGVRSLAVAENFFQDKIHLLMELCKESNEGKEATDTEEKTELEGIIDEKFGGEGGIKG